MRFSWNSCSLHFLKLFESYAQSGLPCSWWAVPLKLSYTQIRTKWQFNLLLYHLSLEWLGDVSNLMLLILLNQQTKQNFYKPKVTSFTWIWKNDYILEVWGLRVEKLRELDIKFWPLGYFRSFLVTRSAVANSCTWNDKVAFHLEIFFCKRT